MDETSTNLTYCRRYARAEAAARAPQATPLHGGPNVTLVAALTPAGLRAAMTVSGAVNGDVFVAYPSQVLGPPLEPGDVVVLDNLPAHKVAGLAQLVEACGARLLYGHLTRLALLPSNWPSASSKAGCARPRSVPERRWRASSKPLPTG